MGTASKASKTSWTEKIISFAAKQAVDRVFGGPTKIVTGYHKTHFILLSRAIGESNRDEKLQKTLRELRKNLGACLNAGKKILGEIPPEPAPPSENLTAVLANPERAAAYTKRCDDFAKGVKAITGMLDQHSRQIQDIVRDTETKLNLLEKKLNMKGSKWPDMRRISNRQRGMEIVFLKTDDIPALAKHLGVVKSRLRAYKNF